MPGYTPNIFFFTLYNLKQAVLTAIKNTGIEKKNKKTNFNNMLSGVR